MDTVTQYGRKWDVRIPRGDLRLLMGRVHVGTPDNEIRQQIRERIANCIDARWTDELIEQAADFAVACHHENQGLYVRVTRGTPW